VSGLKANEDFRNMLGQL
jgi:hypothetical protein